MRSSPRAGRFVVRLLLPPDLAEAVEGDLEEGFRRRAARGGARAGAAARIWFWWQVVTMPYGRLRRRERRRRPAGGGTGRDGRREAGGMGSFGMDVRVAVRTLWRRPVFTVATVLTLVMSVGAATLLFSVTEGVLLRPLPWDDPDRVVNLYLLNEEWRESENELLRRNWDRYNIGRPQLDAFRAAPGPLEEVGFYVPTHRTLARGEREEPTSGGRVDRGVFPILGVEPALGRLPTSDEYAEGAPVAVLRHDLWRETFDGDPDVIGTAFRYGERLHTVIGVMPAGFFFPSEGVGRFWTPIPPAEGDFIGFGLGRLAPGFDVAGASAALDRITRRLGEDDPGLSRLGARAEPALDTLVGSVREGVLLLFGTGLVVLMVACVNLATLVLARSRRRRGELAVRAALGATRRSLIRTVSAEVWIVSLVGGVLGLALAGLTLRPFIDALATSVGSLPRSSGIGINGSVLAFTAVATMGTALLAGLPGALSATRGPAGPLAEGAGRGGGHGGGRGRTVLLALQVGLAALLLAGGGLMVRSVMKAGAIDPGFEVDGLAWLTVTPREDAGEGRAGRAALVAELRAELARLPGVESVGFGSSLPLKGGLAVTALRAASAPEGEGRQVAFTGADAGYFETVGIPVLRGRVSAGEGAPGGPVPVVVSESLARTVSEGDGALGTRLRRGAGDDATDLEVVAVVADARQFILVEPVDHLYAVDGSVGTGRMFAFLRTGEEPGDVLARARAALAAGFPDVALGDQGTTRADVSGAVQHLRVRAVLMGTLAALASVLAMVGIAGIAAHFVGERRREIAIRMALGAEASREVGRVVVHALAPAAVGLLAGLGTAWGLSRLVADLVFETSTTDPATYVLVGFSLAAVCALAAWLPGRRATSVDPARILDRE